MAIQEIQRGQTQLHLVDRGAVPTVYREIVNRHVSTVGVEGPPIYAVPHPARRSQQWQSSEFQLGWQATNTIFTALRNQGMEVHHWVLVDDVNNTDRPAQPRVLGNTIRAVRRELGSPAVLDDIRHRRTFLESRFVRADRSENRCSNLDAAFQLQKLHHAREKGALNSHVQLIVHPVDFQHQQGLMLANLLAEMKSDPHFQKLSKQERRNLIEQTYLHVWVDGEGNTFATRPKWDGQRFIFEEVSHAA